MPNDFTTTRGATGQVTSMAYKAACLLVWALLLLGCRDGNKAQSGTSTSASEQRGAKRRACPAGAQCTWDEHGHLLTEKGAKPGKDGSYRRTYKYDSRGNLTEELIVSGLEASIGPFETRKVYTYDARSRRVGRAEESRSNWKPNGASRACTYDPPCAPPFSDCKEVCGEWQARPRQRQAR